jgi:hypothetical protein
MEHVSYIYTELDVFLKVYKPFVLTWPIVYLRKPTCSSLSSAELKFASLFQSIENGMGAFVWWK